MYLQNTELQKQTMTSHLEQQLASLQLDHGDIQANRKVGPAVPPKPKKSQPQVSNEKLVI
jgi:hypothetical protein